MIRSSSALERASPMDLTRSRNSFDCPHPPCDPIASSRPIVRSCSIAPTRASDSPRWRCRRRGRPGRLLRVG
ncbi:hypothetical protein GUJ93_ZPchr0001g29857 [Zizania palustris]|uniref:Uncharacterized protein n=1 Tax=Zizania palustris TaxID=103762 RepID=A0A8J5SBE0_ZIZPA|nr:hypothetical protein GUJ93_ZPchr0115g2733 [Zizania palustris]KAG8054216.1 hypothetical protein GUJ93_ZPchr0001g29857 [Zizania palustris]